MNKVIKSLQIITHVYTCILYRKGFVGNDVAY